MIQVSKVLIQGQGLAPVLLKRATSVELNWAARQTRRVQSHDSAGRELNILLAAGSPLRVGDVLVAEDGSLIRILACPEPLLRISAGGETGSQAQLLGAAYHLGRLQVAVECLPDHLKIEPDLALAQMLRALHLNVVEVNEGFSPEGELAAAATHDHASAPAHDPGHGHVHGPGCGHAHGHAAAPKPLNIQVSAKATPHVHGPACGHDHADHPRDHKHD